MDEKCAMILQLQRIGFVLIDLNLYLDTHPMDTAALACYNAYHEQYHEMMMEYNARFGPLMNFGHAPGGMDRFLWVMGPWPWQACANPDPCA